MILGHLTTFDRTGVREAMTGVRCPACAKASMHPWRNATASDVRLAAQPTYRLNRCGFCGSAQIAPCEIIDEGAASYEAGTYTPVPTRFDPLIELARRLIDSDRLRLVGPLKTGASVLEVGAGDGRFLDALARRGYRVSGIEPSAPFAARARSRGLDVESASVEDATVAAGSQDAVINWHVLEHLREPSTALERAREWLVPAGTLVVAVPNLSSLQALIGNDHWFHQDVPRHRCHFSASGARLLLERSGFAIRSVHHILLEHNLLGMHQTLLNLCTSKPNVLFNTVKRNLSYESRFLCAWDVGITTLVGIPLVPVAAALELVAGACRRGGTLVVRAERR
jgi:2-polyprenyl-3-methyl-5-hydroxy-6-metoxy-1,4-benzoquinol methylase